MQGARLRLVVLAAGLLAGTPALGATANVTVTVRSSSGAPAGTVAGPSLLPAMTCSSGSTCVGSVTFTGSTQVVLTAAPGAGAPLPTWVGCTTVVGNACNLTISGNRSVTVTFPPASYSLTMRPTATGGATGGVSVATTPPVACSTPQASCVAQVPYGATVAVTATAGSGSAFNGWSGACTGTGACNVVGNAAKSVTASFVRASYQVSVGFMGGVGTITSSGGIAPNLNCASPGSGTCSGALLAGGTMLLTATPNAMSDFTGWGGCTSVAGNVCTISSPTANRVVTAGFQAKACNACHGVPPAAPHMQTLACGNCHDGYTYSSVNPLNHLNGSLDVSFVCGACHGVPPSDNAHVLHSGAPVFPPTMGYGEVTKLEDYDPAAYTATAYKFGCGQCHPMDMAKHLDGTTDVEVSPLGAPVGSMRAMNDVSAQYVGTIGQKSGSCSGVSCHSTGQATPTFVSSPAWNTTQPISCDACHANPPKYPNGGPDSGTENTHVVLADDGGTLGHFGGLIGPWLYSFHGYSNGVAGVRESAPITCQTCHLESVDRNNTGPSGFYYLDTSGDYQIRDAAGNPAATLYDACGNCHTGLAGAAPKGWGKAAPLRHVNGRPDVVFDTRDLPGALTGYPGAPSGINLQPYWFANPYYGGPSALYNGAVCENNTWSVNLKSASYDYETKTCTNVACHLQESNSDFPALPPLRWGKTPVGWASCDACHGYSRP